MSSTYTYHYINISCIDRRQHFENFTNSAGVNNWKFALRIDFIFYYIHNSHKMYL